MSGLNAEGGGRFERVFIDLFEVVCPFQIKKNLCNIHHVLHKKSIHNTYNNAQK